MMFAVEIESISLDRGALVGVELGKFRAFPEAPPHPNPSPSRGGAFMEFSR